MTSKHGGSARSGGPQGLPGFAASSTRPVFSRPRVLRLHGERSGGVRFLSDIGIQLAEDAKQSWVTLTRTGRFFDPRYGDFEITSAMLSEMVANFDAGVAGQEIFLDVEHDRRSGAAAKIVELKVNGNRLRALVEWTPYGLEAVRSRGFRYLSAEFHEDYVDNETRRKHGTVLLGGGLTTRPVIKRLDPVELAESHVPPNARALLHPELVRQLSENARNSKMKSLEALRKKLSALGLADAVVKQLCEAAKAAATHIGEDEDALKALASSFEATGKSLAESIGDKEIKLAIDIPGTAGDGDHGTGNGARALSEEKVGEIVAKQLAAAQEKAEQDRKAHAARLDARKKTFTDAIEAAEGLSDETKKELSESVDDLITAEMSEEQVAKLAEYQIAQGNKLESARKLSALGYQDSRGGTPHVTADDGGTVKKLSQCIRDNLSKTSTAQFGGLKLPEKDNPFVSRVLAEFDRRNASRIDRELKVLAGDVSVDSNTDLPVGFQREVIREALSDLNVLNLLQTLTDFNATTTVQIPYEERDDSTIVNDGIVHEGAGIPSAGISQKMDSAYVQKMALAMKVTNEVMFFTRASMVNWDAFARNAESNARFIRELLQKRVANELMRSADAFMAADVSDESIAAQLDGSTHTIKTAEFPIVRPRQVRDIAGNAIGNAQNPITIDFDGTPVTEYDGTGNQSAGTYFRVTDYNLGYIQLVDESGTPATPNEATATISYSYATNVVKWDSDVGSATVAEHYDGLLRAIGARKAVLNGERQVNPDFLLLSPTLEDEATNAKGFVPLTQRPGSGADDVTGMLQRIKGLPAFTTNAPNLDMGDSRIIIGQRGVGAYAITRPWQVGQPFEAVNSDGQPTGQKVAYGEEYNAVHVPTPVRNRLTSVLVYSDSDR